MVTNPNYHQEPLLLPSDQAKINVLKRIACALEEIRDELRKIDLKALRKEQPTKKMMVLDAETSN